MWLLIQSATPLLLSEDIPMVSSEDSKQARRFNLLAMLHPTKQVLATPYYFDHSQHIHMQTRIRQIKKRSVKRIKKKKIRGRIRDISDNYCM